MVHAADLMVLWKVQVSLKICQYKLEMTPIVEGLTNQKKHVMDVLVKIT